MKEMCLYVMMNDRKKSNIPVLFSLKSCKDLQSQGSILASTILLFERCFEYVRLLSFRREDP